VVEQDLELLGNHREHLKVDTVELIETSPSTRGRESLEESSNHDVVHTVGTVEHNALLGQSLCQILGGLSLTCSSWTSWGSSQVELESTHEGHVTLICEWGNDESESVSEILVTVGVVCLDALDSAVFVLPVVSQLLDPVEGSYLSDLVVNETLNDLQGMHINCDQGTHRDGEKLSHFSSDDLDKTVKLIIKFLEIGC
jgi:hypothetical protein